MNPAARLYLQLLAAEKAHRADPYWGPLEAMLDTIETTKPTTSSEVIRILGGANGKAFFNDGGNRTLWDVLDIAGWEPIKYEASYWWAMKSPNGDRIEFCEGDVIDITE